MSTENQNGSRRRNRRWVMLLILLLILLFVLVRCLTQFPAPVRSDCPECIQLEEREAALPEVELQDNLLYVPNQVILVGLKEDLELVTRQVNAAGVPLELVIDEPLPDLLRGDEQQQSEEGTAANALTANSTAAVLTNLPPGSQANLYRWSPESGVSVERVFNGLRDTIRELGNELQGRPVWVDLNYVTGTWGSVSGAPWGIDGAPWGIDGAPWGIDGAPWGIDGARWGIDGASFRNPWPQIATTPFWQQWALGQEQGIGLMTPDGAARLPRIGGQGYRVVAFDTSPFAEPGQYTFYGWTAPEPPPLTMTVSHSAALPSSDEEYDLSDHGLFVAGLVYAVAPESEIHLVRVLNKQGKGDLHSLLRAMNDVIRQIEASDNGSLDHTVFNLSLTIQPGNPEEGIDPLPPEVVSAIKELAGLREEDSLPILSLEVPMEYIRGLGGTVVAAAGNTSYDNPPNPPDAAALPAAYSQVIGVEAANQQGERSCYSNQASIGNGDLRAPGGEGGPLPPEKEKEADPPLEEPVASCTPRHYTCDARTADCPYGVISMTLSTHRGFAYWVGSSFAAPLVSGLAALELETGTHPADVATEISTQNGIINIPGSLE